MKGYRPWGLLLGLAQGLLAWEKLGSWLWALGSAPLFLLPLWDVQEWGLALREYWP